MSGQLLEMDDLEKLPVGGSVLKEPLMLRDFSDDELMDPEVATWHRKAVKMGFVFQKSRLVSAYCKGLGSFYVADSKEGEVKSR